MTTLRDPHADEAALLAGVQEHASVAALSHIFPPDQYPYPRKAIATRWTQALEDPGARVVVADHEGELVAVALVRFEWLDGLYVLPDHWGSGIAGTLHDRALGIARELGSESCHLWVLEDNARARRFYERRGWYENGRTRVVPYPPNPLDVGYTHGFLD